MIKINNQVIVAIQGIIDFLFFKLFQIILKLYEYTKKIVRILCEKDIATLAH